MKVLGNCSAVAEWLNEQGIPVGKYSRRQTWTGAMVRRLTRNPLLKGMPGRGFTHTVKHHETGKRIAVKSPNGPRFREYPDLAHIDPTLWDEVNALLDAKNDHFQRKKVNGQDPLRGMPRKRTRFPGQYARCWYCGRHYVWGGNGMTENLMCSGCREWQCWNSVGFNGALAARKIVEAVTTELYRLDGFDDQFRELIRQAGHEDCAGLMHRRQKLKRSEDELSQQKENLLAAITAYGPLPMFQQKLSEMEKTAHELAKEKQLLERLNTRKLQLPESTADLRQMLEEQFQVLAIDSLEFGGLIQQLVPEFWVYLVRLCDGGHLLPRAKLQLNLAGIIPDAKHVPGLEGLLTRE